MPCNSITTRNILMLLPGSRNEILHQSNDEAPHSELCGDRQPILPTNRDERAIVLAGPSSSQNRLNSIIEQSAQRAFPVDDLPPPNTARWVARRKAAVVAAVRSGSIPVEEALSRYQLSEEEFLS